MVFKNDIKKKIPDYLQDIPEFKVFTALIKKEDIKGPASLRKYLEVNITELKKDMTKLSKANQGGTMTRKIRPIAKKIDFLKFTKQKFLKYL
jgi:hypothetical protein